MEDADPGRTVQPSVFLVGLKSAPDEAINDPGLFKAELATRMYSLPAWFNSSPGVKHLVKMRPAKNDFPLPRGTDKIEVSIPGAKAPRRNCFWKGRSRSFMAGSKRVAYTEANTLALSLLPHGKGTGVPVGFASLTQAADAIAADSRQLSIKLPAWTP